MKLAYQAYDQAGQAVNDTVEARDVTDATEALRRRGLFVTQIRETIESSEPATTGKRAAYGRSGRLKKLAMFTRQFHILTATGTPIIDALDALQRQTTDAAWKNAIGAMKGRIEGGSSLSEAMQEQSSHFDPIYRSLVAAREASGKLSPILAQLAFTRASRSASATT